MKTNSLIIIATLAAILSGCNSVAQREDGLPELPKFLMDKALGASYYVDTLFAGRGNAYCVLQNPEYGQRILYDNDRVYASSPLMTIDSISPAVYKISQLARSAEVNFTNPATLQLIDTVVPRYGQFKRYVKGFMEHTPLAAAYGFTLDMPGKDVTAHKQVERWLVDVTGCGIAEQAKIDFGEVSEGCAKKFFDSISRDGDEAPEQSEDLYSADFYSVYCYIPDSYVTYLCYSYSYTGGAHGMYNIRLVTYSFGDKAPVTLDTLFKPGTDSDVRELIIESMAADPAYARSHNITTVAGVKTELAAMNIAELPLTQPALLPEGIVFCYQPYDIGPYSDGAYQFVVPWAAVEPYLR